MAVKRVRFGVDVGSQVSELFSLTEKTDGTIILFFRTAATETMNRFKGESAVVEKRTTLHTSRKSKDGGKAFVHTTRYADGRRFRNVAYVVPNGIGISWLLASVLSQNLNLPKYQVSPKAGERTVLLDRMNCDRMTLIYHIVVTTNGFCHPIGNINQIHEHFSEFTVSVYWLFMAAPSIPKGRHFALGTSLLTINGFYTQLDPFPKRPVRSPTTDEIAHQFNGMNREFQDSYKKHFLEWVDRPGSVVTQETIAALEDCLRTIFVRPPLEFSSPAELPQRSD